MLGIKQYVKKPKMFPRYGDYNKWGGVGRYRYRINTHPHRVVVKAEWDYV